jgi:hypothetical protein
MFAARKETNHRGPESTMGEVAGTTRKEEVSRPFLRRTGIRCLIATHYRSFAVIAAFTNEAIGGEKASLR